MEPIEKLQSWLGTGAINIFGRPFAGKDTQGGKLLDLFGGVMLGGGDILRNSTIPEEINAVMMRGELIPTSDYISIVLPYLAKTEFAGKPLILSSVGRWIGEESGVIEALAKANHTLKAVIYLDISEDDVRKRWHALAKRDDRSKRNDDTLAALEIRLDEYRNKTLPVIDEYDRLGLLVRINGAGTVESVHEKIRDALVQRQSSDI